MDKIFPLLMEICKLLQAPALFSHCLRSSNATRTLKWNYSRLRATLMSCLHLCLQNLARATWKESAAQRTAVPFPFPAWQQTSCTCEWKKEARSVICCDLQQPACKAKWEMAIRPLGDRSSSLAQAEESPRPSHVWKFWNEELEDSTRCPSSTTRQWMRSGRILNREHLV